MTKISITEEIIDSLESWLSFRNGTLFVLEKTSTGYRAMLIKNKYGAGTYQYAICEGTTSIEAIISVLKKAENRKMLSIC